MEVLVPCNTSSAASLDIRSSSSSGSSSEPHHLTQYQPEGFSMNDLKTCLPGILNAEDIGALTCDLNLSPGVNDICNVVKENENKGPGKNTTGNSASEKCLSKCASFPPLHGPTSPGDVLVGDKGKHEENITDEVTDINGSTKPFNKSYSRCMSLPVPLRSAMKGSRENQGIPPKKLSVTWAADVYDPIPTSVSHVPSNKNQSYRSKKSGKYKHKSNGKSSRGSKGKEKKQVRKSSGGSTKLKPFLEDNGVGFGEPHVGTVDFDVESPDPFCGSSFLKKSVAKMHFPVAEAT